MKIAKPMPIVLVYQLAKSYVIEEYLRFYNFEVIESTTEDIKKKAQKGGYDLCIIDHYNGLELLKSIREFDDEVPIIMVSKKFRHEHIIQALNAGADDYISIPYNLEELVSRVKALLRRAGVRTRHLMDNYQIGDYAFDVRNKMLIIGDDEIKLNQKETQILALLCAYKNELLPRNILMREIWGDDNYLNKKSLNVYIYHLRDHLSRDSKVKIDTLSSLGYSLLVIE